MPIYFNNNKVGAALELKNLQEKTVTENNVTVTPDPGYNGLSSVDVNIVTGDYNIDQIIDGDECELVITLADGKEVVLDLPEELQFNSPLGQSREVFTFQVTDDIILYSGSNIALWEYTISTNSWRELTDYSSRWGNFQIINNKCIVGAMSNGVSIVYDITTKTVKKLMRKTSTGTTDIGASNFYVIGTKCLIGSSWGLWLYDSEIENTESGDAITVMTTINEAWDATKCFRFDNKLLLGGNGTNYGTILLNIDTFEYKYILTDISLRYFAKINNEILMSGAYSTLTGLWVYNILSDTVTHIDNEYYDWRDMTTVGDRCFCSKTQSNIGMWVYYQPNKTFTQIYNSGQDFHYVIPVENGILFSSSNFSTKGLYYYNFDISSIENIATNYSAYRWRDYKIINSKLIIFGSDNKTGIYIYENVDGIISFTQVFSAGNYNSFKLINDTTVEIYNSDKTTNKFIVHYDTTTKIAKLVKYYIGKV